MYSTLTLTGTHILEPLTLSRKESFPSRQRDFVAQKFYQRADWHAAPLPKDAGHLQVSLQLEERMSFGRSAVVYAAKIIHDDMGEQHGVSPTTVSPSDDELCVKIARPNRCRTLAREAWVYEQLSELAAPGAITPRYYGFFAATISSDMQSFSMWTSHDFHLEIEPRFWDDADAQELNRDDSTRDDPLTDDKAQVEDTSPGCRELSPWVDWKPDLNAPLLSVLVLARGGPSYTPDEDDMDPATQ